MFVRHILRIKSGSKWLEPELLKRLHLVEKRIIAHEAGHLFVVGFAHLILDDIKDADETEGSGERSVDQDSHPRLLFFLRLLSAILQSTGEPIANAKGAQQERGSNDDCSSRSFIYVGDILSHILLRPCSCSDSVGGVLVVLQEVDLTYLLLLGIVLGII